jgi:predicted GNAT family acetyltransferase
MSALAVETTGDPAEFLRRAGPFLQSHPVEHNILLTTATNRASGMVTDPQPALWAWVALSGDVVAAVQHTPPYGAYLSLGPAKAFSALARALDQAGRQLPGVGGLAEGPRVFAEEWTLRRRVVVAEGMRQGVYAATKIQPPESVPGCLRPAALADAALLQGWADGFSADTGIPALETDAARRRIGQGSLFVWEVNDRPVSMVASNPAGGVSRIGFVYTPRPLRGHGYASACVAALSQAELSKGLTCMLYTDLSNPTSNSIYQRIGYVRVADASQLEFQQI